jgi:pimeloyl-ACP methyl ester carboxylesterase
MQSTITAKRWFFPVFNAFIGLILGGLTGYYLRLLWPCIGLGLVFGLLVGTLVEWLTGLSGMHRFLYRRRPLLAAILEIILIIFVVAPYAFAYLQLRPQPRTICCVTPLDYGAAAYEEVRIPTTDAITLAGWYVPPRETPGAVIIILHGSGGDRRGCEWYARQFIAAGYGILLYDQRALGESGGATQSYGWLDGADLLDAAGWLAVRSDVDASRIGAVGLSGGGNISLNAAHLDPDKIAAYWLDGVWAQRIPDFPQSKNIGEQFATLINGIILKMAEIQVGRSAPPAFSEILPQLKNVPIVLVAAELDDFEVRVNRQYAEILPPNIESWIIPDAYHVGGPLIIPQEYSQKMLGFFSASFEK